MSTEIEQLRRDIEALKSRHAAPIGDAKDFTTAQLKMQAAYEALGDAVLAPLPGETYIPFLRRLIGGRQHLSKRWAAIPLGGINDRATLEAILDEVRHDSATNAGDPSRFKPGEIHAIRTPDGAGRPITRYVGHPNACWDQFNPPIRYLPKGLNSFTAPKIGAR